MSQKTHIERLIGDPKNISRRDTIAGAATVVISLLVSSALGGAALSTANKVKDYIAKRTAALYANDAANPLRTSHTNPEVLTLYKEYLSPGAVLPSKTELSHRLLHTTYGDKIPAHVVELEKTTVAEAEHESAAFMAEQK